MELNKGKLLPTNSFHIALKNSWEIKIFNMLGFLKIIIFLVPN